MTTTDTELVKFIDEARVVRVAVGDSTLFEGSPNDADAAVALARGTTKAYARFLREATDRLATIAAGLLEKSAYDIDIRQSTRDFRKTPFVKQAPAALSEEQRDERNFEEEARLAAFRAEQEDAFMREAFSSESSRNFDYDSPEIVRPSPISSSSTVAEEEDPSTDDEPEMISRNWLAAAKPRRRGVYDINVIAMAANIPTIARQDRDNLLTMAAEHANEVIRTLQNVRVLARVDSAEIAAAFLDEFYKGIANTAPKSAASVDESIGASMMDSLGDSGRQLLHAAELGRLDRFGDVLTRFTESQDENAQQILAGFRAIVTRLAEKRDLIESGISRNADLVGIAAVAYGILGQHDYVGEVDKEAVFYTVSEVKAGRMNVADAFERLRTISRRQRTPLRIDVRVGRGQWDLKRHIKKQRRRRRD